VRSGGPVPGLGPGPLGDPGRRAGRDGRSLRPGATPPPGSAARHPAPSPAADPLGEWGGTARVPAAGGRAGSGSVALGVPLTALIDAYEQLEAGSSAGDHFDVDWGDLVENHGRLVDSRRAPPPPTSSSGASLGGGFGGSDGGDPYRGPAPASTAGREQRRKAASSAWPLRTAAPWGGGPEASVPPLAPAWGRERAPLAAGAPGGGGGPSPGPVPPAAGPPPPGAADRRRLSASRSLDSARGGATRALFKTSSGHTVPGRGQAGACPGASRAAAFQQSGRTVSQSRLRLTTGWRDAEGADGAGAEGAGDGPAGADGKALGNGATFRNDAPGSDAASGDAGGGAAGSLCYGDGAAGGASLHPTDGVSKGTVRSVPSPAVSSRAAVWPPGPGALAGPGDFESGG